MSSNSVSKFQLGNKLKPRVTCTSIGISIGVKRRIFLDGNSITSIHISYEKQTPPLNVKKKNKIHLNQVNWERRHILKEGIK